MKSTLINLLIAFVAGGLYALTYPSEIIPSGWFPLLFIALPLFLWKLEKSKTLPESLAIILFYNLGLNMVGYYWIPHTLREFGDLPYLVSLLVGALFSLILQPHWWAYAIWKKYRPQWQWTSEKAILITALIMTVLERYIPQQFPSFVGSPWLNLAPYLGLAPVFGVAIFSFMTFWISLEVINQLLLKKFRPIPWIAMAVFVLLNALIPLGFKPHEKTLNVRVVQANIGNFIKVASERGDRGSISAIIQRYQDLSLTDNGFRPELIVWPETAYPETFRGKDSPVPGIFRNIMEQTGADVLIGGYDQNPDKDPFDFVETVYNSSILMSEGKIKSSYHKNILIPFGETLPFGPFNSQVISIVPAVSLFARGQGTPQMETKDGLRFVTPICYEILESHYMRNMLNEWDKNHFMVNHTNDSWYGDTAEPFQHLFLSKWRSLEFQLPTIRSTNTGVSSIIYPDASESKRLGVGEEGILDVVLQVGKGEGTIYQRFGIYPFYLIFLCLLGITWWRERN